MARRVPKRGDFVDMTGQSVAGVQVHYRAANAAGTACWWITCSCGNQLVEQGTILRFRQSQGRRYQCKKCRPTPAELARARFARLRNEGDHA